MQGKKCLYSKSRQIPGGGGQKEMRSVIREENIKVGESQGFELLWSYLDIPPSTTSI